MMAKVGERVFEQGKSTDGQRIDRGKGYSDSWGQIRADKGRQASFVDLDFTGVLRQSLEIRPTPEGFQMAFRGGSSSANGVTAAEKASFAESSKKFGQRPIFDPSKEEIDLIFSAL